LGFEAADFSGALVVFLSPVFWRRAGGASTGVVLLSATHRILQGTTPRGFPGVFGCALVFFPFLSIYFYRDLFNS